MKKNEKYKIKSDREQPIRRSRTEILSDIDSLVKSPGYIYSLLLIETNDLFLPVEEYISVDWRSRLSFQEINYLFGLLVKKELSFSIYPSPKELAKQVESTYKLMEELHLSHSLDGLIPLLEETQQKQKDGLEIDPADMFSRSEMIVEAVFYDESGAYDHQYVETTPKRYKRDEDWIKHNLGFSIEGALRVIGTIKRFTQEKRHKLKTDSPQNLFDSLRNIYTITPKELEHIDKNAKKFLDFFSINPGEANSKLLGINETNQLNVKPIIKIDDNSYLLPVSFYLFRSIDESPFTLMFLDKKYKSMAEKNRGDFTEEECYEQLKKIFGTKNVYKRVQVQTIKGDGKKKQPIKTDIDVFTIFGNKAIVVQSKSKKMTLLSRQGDVKTTKIDFAKAIQDSYEQALKCRQHIFERDALLIDENGSEIKLDESINEVYLILVTTDYYPALSMQTKELLKNDHLGTSPIALNLYDLQLLVEYLPDPFDFIFYINQRTLLAEKTIAGGEMSYLGFHLQSKLYIDPKQENQFLAIDSSCGQYIDDDVIRKRYGTKKERSESKLSQKWLDPDYKELLRIIKTSKIPGLLDGVIFLLQLAPDSVEFLVKYIRKTKQKAIATGKGQSFTLELYSGTGISYLVEPDPKIDISERIMAFGMARKYKAKADEWMVLGSYSQSEALIDSVAYSKEEWSESPKLEKLVEVLLNKNPIKIVNKVGRNEPCPCGSGKKYKKCHYIEDTKKF